MLFSDNLNKNPLFTSAVKLAIKNLLPWTKLEFSLCDCHDNFSSHHLTFQMGISIVLADIVAILLYRLMRSKLLKPDLEIMVKTGFIIVNEDGSSDMHGIFYSESLTRRFLPRLSKKMNL